MIRTFSSSETERLFKRERVVEFVNIERVALRRLVALDNAIALTDLRIPPENSLEALKGDRAGQHSIRINDQYRICFTWKEDGAYGVEITKHYD
jgi:proteic killer suppression protein